ncbi:MAG TPA: response regulator, partial [Tepidisphaeraceae bacterium]|nr:response regulator [Tepidisphaeraceae bacterium]
GATFTVEMATIPAPAKSDAAPRSADSPRRGLRILLVEDHEMTARVISRLLQGLDYDVRTAGSVQSALQAARNEKFDLLISDLGLPDGSGLDLMRELRQMYHLKGIAVSGYGMEEDIRRSRDVGFSVHLTKPISLEKLQAAINHIA